MARYIDADKLIAHLEDEIKGCEKPFGSRANGKSIAYGTSLGLKSAISFAQTLLAADDVEVVRCENCRHWDKENIKKCTYSSDDSTLVDFAECLRWSNWSICHSTRYNDYCSLAEERKKEYTEGDKDDNQN